MEQSSVVFGLRSKKISASLTKTRQGFFGQVMRLLGTADITDQMWEELEDLLIQADVAAKHGRVLQLMKIARTVGIETIAMAVDSKEE